MSETWTRWQGHVIHDGFTLGRCLGCSDHSAVFLAHSAAPGPSEVAVKLLAADRALAELQLPRWKRAEGLVHPHLLGLLQCGGCQLGGLPHLYVVMEYADQTLAQVLQRRALTDDEAREMLRPALEALAFVHGQNLVHGQLKPANILVIGDQLKLASDTIRRIGEATMSAKTPTVYDPPEGRHGASSTSGDIWALGVCLFEALTRRPPSGWGDRTEAIALPDGFSPAYRGVVARCLDPNPQKRPSVTELVAWDDGRGAGSWPEPTIQPATPEPTPLPVTPPPAAPEAAKSAPSMAKPQNPRALLAAALGAAVILVLGWTGVRMVKSHRTPASAPAPGGSLSQAAGASPGAPAAAVQVPASAVLPPKPPRSELATAPSALNEVIPEVPQSARRTISGHIDVWVRVIVDQDGSVFAATADRSGPSRYFERLAVEAARKWTFPPIDTPSRRLIQIRFDFSRDATTARSLALQ